MVFAMKMKQRYLKDKPAKEEGLTSEDKEIVNEVMERNDKALRTLAQM